MSAETRSPRSSREFGIPATHKTAWNFSSRIACRRSTRPQSCFCQNHEAGVRLPNLSEWQAPISYGTQSANFALKDALSSCYPKPSVQQFASENVTILGLECSLVSSGTATKDEQGRTNGHGRRIVNRWDCNFWGNLGGSGRYYFLSRSQGKATKLAWPTLPEALRHALCQGLSLTKVGKVVK